MKSHQIRTAFIKFFEQKGHTHVASSSLVPNNDPTLLFANAGMNQFKDYFLGLKKPPFKRAVTSQKCVRAGGKHNDLENVGYTARHHTFFEMLGNFSFGDYFKNDALAFAWEFLTSSDWLNIPADKLLVTVYAVDDEAYDIWANDIGIPKERIIKIGDKGTKYVSDNFWTMGDTGPCGPCSEIFFDHGADVAGDPPGSPNEDGDRFIEIWNCVFMQFNRTADGVMHNLPRPSVDTGMGLERISAVLQKVHSNYEIDLFQNLLYNCAAVIGCANDDNPSLKVIADHIRACTFLVADGVIPNNEGRGYVLRRIIRRALRHGHKLGVNDNFFYRLVNAVVVEMGDAYPQIKEQQQHIEQVLLMEEQQFNKTLEQGLKILSTYIETIDNKIIDGEIAFKLYDTYGFPLDLTADIAREHNLIVDESGFDECMKQQKERARKANNFKVANLQIDANSQFCGYEQNEVTSQIISIISDNQLADTLSTGEKGILILANTPFYAESGGQVGDTGTIVAGDNIFTVTDTQKHGDAILHHGVVQQGNFSLQQEVNCQIDIQKRRLTAVNHSAAHLLYAALRKVLGTHVTQKGSHVNHERMRFDFSHPEKITAEQIIKIEDLVNQQIWSNSPVITEITDLETARKKGVLALFDEKYGDKVRMLTMGENGFSTELCGGTHAKNTGDLGLFKIVTESSQAAGIRRIEAVTQQAAINLYRDAEQQINLVASLLRVPAVKTCERITNLLKDNQDLSSQLGKLKHQNVQINIDEVIGKSILINDIAVIAQQIDVETKVLLGLLDQLKQKLPKAVILLASVQNDKAVLCAGVTKSITTTFSAGELVKIAANIIDGKGGGRSDTAQGGGTNLGKLKQALACVEEYVRNK